MDKPAIIDSFEVARLLGCDVSVVLQYDEQEKIPRPMRFNKNRMWMRNDIWNWIKEGMPNRSAWEFRHHR